MEKPKISCLTATYTQDSDDNDIGGSQEIVITAEPALINLFENKRSEYFITIKTERWAVDNVRELTDLLQGFLKMVNLNKE
jgi:hypothetical protein